MIPFNDFRRLLAAVFESANEENYIARHSGTVPLDSADDAIRLLRTVWAMADGGLTIKKIASVSGHRTARSLAPEYQIPARTLEDWGAGVRNPPEWQLPIIAYAVISDIT